MRLSLVVWRYLYVGYNTAYHSPIQQGREQHQRYNRRMCRCRCDGIPITKCISLCYELTRHVIVIVYGVVNRVVSGLGYSTNDHHLNQCWIIVDLTLPMALFFNQNYPPSFSLKKTLGKYLWKKTISKDMKHIPHLCFCRHFWPFLFGHSSQINLNVLVSWGSNVLNESSFFIPAIIVLQCGRLYKTVLSAIGAWMINYITKIMHDPV